MNWVSVTVDFRNVEKYKDCEIILDFNTELMKYESSVETPLYGYNFGCYPTKTGVVLFGGIADDVAIPGNEYSGRATGYLNVYGTGELNMKMTVNVTDKNDNPVDVKVKFKQPYEKIVDVSEVAFVNTEKFEMKYQNIMIKHDTRVVDLVGADENKSAVVINSNGEALENDAIVPNGAILATMYSDFVADKVQICVMEDVNCDAKITAADARLALRCSAKLEKLDGVRSLAADVNNDNKITSADARLILRKAAGLD